MRHACGRILALCTALLLASGANAATRIEVTDTFPEGEPVTLEGGENFYLRLHYETDRPVSIWAQPYFRGEPVSAGSNPSSSYTGSGDALGWFFLQTADGAVDEVRIMVGDGTRDGTTLALSYAVRVIAGRGRGARSAPPQWVTQLIEADAARRRAGQERSASASGGSGLFLAGFMIAVLALLVAAIVLPLRAVRRWHGGWRLAATVPIAVTGFVVLRIIVGVSLDSRSHNLWPFEVLTAGLLSVGAMTVLMFLRKLIGDR